MISNVTVTYLFHVFTESQSLVGVNGQYFAPLRPRNKAHLPLLADVTEVTEQGQCLIVSPPVPKLSVMRFHGMRSRLLMG